MRRQLFRVGKDPLNRGGRWPPGHGRIQRQIIKAFVMTARPVLATGELLEWSHAHLALLGERRRLATTRKFAARAVEWPCALVGAGRKRNLWRVHVLPK